MRRSDRIKLADLTLKALREAFPDSACSLDSDSPERLAIRGILSAQCTDVRVNITAGELFGKCPTMAELDALPEDELIAVIKPCGLYKSKAKSIKTFAHLYCTEWGGEVPTDINALMKCPGVGKKIADRIILELKEKMTDRIGEISSDTFAELSKPTIPTGGNAAEASAALTALGFTGSQAQKALAGLAPDMPVSEMVKEALKKIGSIK